VTLCPQLAKADKLSSSDVGALTHEGRHPAACVPDICVPKLDHIEHEPGEKPPPPSNEAYTPWHMRTMFCNRVFVPSGVNENGRTNYDLRRIGRVDLLSLSCRYGLRVGRAVRKNPLNFHRENANKSGAFFALLYVCVK
jgi:hypothetical protein